MRFLLGLTLTVCTVSVISTALMMLAPDRFRREIKAVISLITAVALCSAILKTDFSGLAEKFSLPDFDSEAVSNDRLIQGELESRISEYLQSLLEEEGIDVKKVSVGTTIDGNRRISITKASLRLGSEEKPREEQVRSLIAQKIGQIDVEIYYEGS